MQNQELDKLKEIFASLEAKATEIKSKSESKADMDGGGCCCDSLSTSCENLYQMIYSLRDYIYQSDARLWDAIYEHKQNHLPPLNAGAMEKLLKTAGLADSFKVEKPTIYISASKNGIFEVDLGKFSKN